MGSGDWQPLASHAGDDQWVPALSVSCCSAGGHSTITLLIGLFYLCLKHLANSMVSPRVCHLFQDSFVVLHAL
jgi:hypothetical protein